MPSDPPGGQDRVPFRPAMTGDDVMSRAIRRIQELVPAAYARLITLIWYWVGFTPYGATCGRTLLLNPRGIQAILQTSDPVGYLAFLLLHEAFHALLNHGIRLKTLKVHKLANIAADYIINALIWKINKQARKKGWKKDPFPIIANAYLDPKISDDKYVEMLYRELLAKQNQPPPPPSNPGGNGDAPDFNDTDDEGDDSDDINPGQPGGFGDPDDMGDNPDPDDWDTDAMGGNADEGTPCPDGDPDNNSGGPNDRDDDAVYDDIDKDHDGNTPAPTDIGDGSDGGDAGDGDGDGDGSDPSDQPGNADDTADDDGPVNTGQYGQKEAANDVEADDGNILGDDFAGRGGDDTFEPELDEGETMEDVQKEIEEQAGRIQIEEEINKRSGCSAGNGDPGISGVMKHRQRQEIGDWHQAVQDWAKARATQRWNQPFNPLVHSVSGLCAPDRGPDGMGVVAIAIDVSWSVPTGHVSEMLSEIQQFLDDLNPERIHLLECPSYVRDTWELEPGDTVPDKLNYGGGTEFMPVFNWIEDNIPGECEGLIYMTDGDSYDMDNVKAMGEPDYPVLWLDWDCCPERYPQDWQNSEIVCIDPES